MSTDNPFTPSPHDHRRFFEADPEPVEIRADLRSSIPADPGTGLRFHPHTSILAAARLAGERGRVLVCTWSKFGGLKVTTAPKHPPDYLVKRVRS
jgi:hypothetical protein